MRQLSKYVLFILFIYYTLFIEEAYLAYCTTIIYHKVLINNKTEQIQNKINRQKY